MRSNLFRLAAAGVAVAACAAPAAGASNKPTPNPVTIAPAPVCATGLLVDPGCQPTIPVYYDAA